MFEITSADNKKFKYFKSLDNKKDRDKSGEYIVEGIKSVNDAVSAGCDISTVIASRRMAENIPEYNYPIYVMPDNLINKLSDTKSPQGLFAVIKKNKADSLPADMEGLYVYCDGISDPGNLGTIIRTADSAGFDGVLLSEGCVDPYNPKTVRSCMGSFFHIKIYEAMGRSFLSSFKEAGGEIYGGILSGDTVDYREPVYGKKTIIVVGNEANGISSEIKGLCIPIKIPIYGKAESLNAGVAAALMMYEVGNQNHRIK